MISVGAVSATFDRLPIRTRLALASALLTFVILCGFALVVGSLTVHRIRSDFNSEVDRLRRRARRACCRSRVTPAATSSIWSSSPNIDEYAAPEHAVDQGDPLHLRRA